MTPKEKQERQARLIDASYNHHHSPPIQELLEKCLPEYRATWEAGRACGFHAGHQAALKSVEVFGMQALLHHWIQRYKDQPVPDPVPGDRPDLVKLTEKYIRDYFLLMGEDQP
jgi:hypothetical protein